MSASNKDRILKLLEEKKNHTFYHYEEKHSLDLEDARILKLNKHIILIEFDNNTFNATITNEGLDFLKKGGYKSKRRKSILKDIWKFIKKYCWKILLIITGIIVTAILSRLL